MTQTVPNFEFSGFYFFDIVRDLRRYMRVNVPEITDESDEEPFSQLIFGWGLAHHIMNTRLDIVANETYLQTARLLESVRLQLKLIDFELKNATPASTELIMQFSSLFTSTTLIVPQNSQFGTEETVNQEQVIYEAVSDNTISRTDRLTGVLVNLSVDITLSNKNVNTFDYVSASTPAEGDVINQNGNRAIIAEIIDANTIRLNDATLITNGSALLATSNFGSNKAGEAITAALTFDFGVTEPRPEDSIYFLHDTVMWDQLVFTVTQGFKTGIKGVWEFFDASLEDENPDQVTNLGSNLEFDVTTLLGTEDRSGSVVTISFAQTSSSETAISIFTGGKNIVRTTGLLGQVTPSTEETDYVVGVQWHPLDITSNTVADSGEFSQDGEINFTLPQTLKRDWDSTSISSLQGFPLRFRVQELNKEAAVLQGTDLNLVGLDSNNYNINVVIDGFAATEIDVTGDAGASPGTYLLSAIITNINNALIAVDASLASTASALNGQLVLTAPDANLGKDSLIQLLAPSGQDATFELFGLSESGFPHTQNGVGGVPTIDLAKIDEGSQYLKFQVVQGSTVNENPLGSSSGGTSQEFELGFTPLIDGTLTVEVDEGSGFTEYTEVDNFLNSDGSSKHYTLEITAEDVATITFGDGTNGKIPPAGVDNIRATYRIGADVNGNVGANTITVNLAGISFVNRIYNPRGATGYAAKQGSTPETLAAAKIEGPASLRILGKAITPSDIEDLAVQFTSPSTGSSPVVRAVAVEETFGIKTVELVVVGSSGNLLNQTQRDELDEYFNGNKETGVEGVLVTNHEVTSVNYTPKPIDVDVTVQGGDEATIISAITALLNPEAKFSDGATFRWNFGDLVPVSIINATIVETDPTNIKNVTFTLPAADVQLGARELPTIGTLNVTVI